MAESSDTDYLGLLGILAAAGIASAGSLYNNRQQRKFQESTNDAAINLANTAHQREVEDLRAAGLNPILSATGSGAPTPSLGTANLDNALDSFGSNASSIGSVISKQRSLANRQASADILKTRAETDASIATAKNLAVQNRNLEAQTRNIEADTALKTAQSKSRTFVGGAVEDLKNHSIPTVSAAKSLFDAYSDVDKAKSESSRLDRLMSDPMRPISRRTLDLMRSKGMSDDEIAERVYRARLNRKP